LGLFQGLAIVFAIITVGVCALLAGLEFSSGWRSGWKPFLARTPDGEGR
jgi:hypothetical protein